AADEELAIDNGTMGNSDDIEAGPAVIQPLLCQPIELLRCQFQHRRGNDELCAGLLLSYDVFKSGHINNILRWREMESMDNIDRRHPGMQHLPRRTLPHPASR